MAKQNKSTFVPKNRRAVCIGINDYPGSGMDLGGCVNDAADWGRILRQRGYQVTTLLDRKATRVGITRVLKDAIGSVAAGDSLVITYSGHGSFVPDTNGDEKDGTDECLCPHDVEDGGPITDDELSILFSELARGVRMVMISDSCHSGSVARFGSLADSRSGSRRVSQQTRFLPPAYFLSRRAVGLLGNRPTVRAASAPGRSAGLLLAGCQDHESSWDDRFGSRANGAFTHYAIKALAKIGKAATYRQWHEAIRRALPNSRHPQTPNLFGNSRSKDWVVLP